MTLEDGTEVATPIAEVKNLNSFRAIKGAIEYESKRQVEQWKKDGVEMGPGRKATFGWDEKMRTVLQRSKEDAHDYRYFPEPDLVHFEWTKHARPSAPDCLNCPKPGGSGTPASMDSQKKTPKLWSPIPTSASSTRMPSKTPHPKQPTPRRNCC